MSKSRNVGRLATYCMYSTCFSAMSNPPSRAHPTQPVWRAMASNNSRKRGRSWRSFLQSASESLFQTDSVKPLTLIWSPSQASVVQPRDGTPTQRNQRALMEARIGKATRC